MGTTVATAPTKGYWAIAVIALLWNLLGVVMFVVQANMTPEMLAALPPEQRQLIEGTPAWIDAAFAVAVFGGVLGALGLLLRKRWARVLFVVSMLALLVQICGSLALTPAWRVHGPAVLAMPVLLLAIAGFLVWYSRKAVARGWIA
ncbi:hypothetical protein [Luteimonas salinilitoris]|uniref:Sugar transporter n=1 Tax=Luteimonas salinilitoris TaxID=3237697 RepID=A0ABV4HP95_9GAMM